MPIPQTRQHTARGASPLRHDWTRAELHALFELPLPELTFRAQTIHRENFDPAVGADFDAAFDQNGRLSGGLRLLSPKCELRHRRTRGKTDAACDRARGGPRRAHRRRQPLLHGCSLALAEGARTRSGLRDGRGCQGARARDLRDARHAHRRTGPQAQRRRARLLQSQPRHLAGILPARSSAPGRIRIVSTPSITSAPPAFMSAAAAS